jgi:hypothetical protein
MIILLVDQLPRNKLKGSTPLKHEHYPKAVSYTFLPNPSSEAVFLEYILLVNQISGSRKWSELWDVTALRTTALHFSLITHINVNCGDVHSQSKKVMLVEMWKIKVQNTWRGNFSINSETLMQLSIQNRYQKWKRRTSSSSYRVTIPKEIKITWSGKAYWKTGGSHSNEY